MRYLLVFGAMFALDYVFAKYTIEATNRKALLASAWAAGIVPLTALVTISYVDNALMVLPATLGAFAGTWFAVVRRKA